MNSFYMCLIIPYYYPQKKDRKHCIMETKGPSMKIMFLNEDV